MKLGAFKLQRIIGSLQLKNALRLIDIGNEGESIFWIEKRTGTSDNPVAFHFRFRKEISNGKEIWWPVSYYNGQGEKISCERFFNGKVLTNLAKQDELISISESWARSLEAEHVVRTVDNALR